MKKSLALLLSVAMSICLFAGCSAQKPASDAVDADTATGVSKIAILLPGYITDESWNQGAYEGLLTLQEEGYEIAYTEDVQAADMESTFRTYCEDGYDFVIGHGVQYGDACVRVAEDFPNVYFSITGNPPAQDNLPENIAFYDYREFDGAYVCGYLAALMSETGVVGYIGGGENSTQCSDKNAFIEGAKAANPDVEMKTVITGTFNDSSVGKETALAMIEQGVDVLLQTCDETGLGAFEACNEQDIYCIGYTSDQAEFVDEGRCLTSLMVSIPLMISTQINAIDDGTFSGTHNPGFAEEVVSLAPFSAEVPQDVIDQVEAVKQSLIDGTLVLTPDYSNN